MRTVRVMQHSGTVRGSSRYGHRVGHPGLVGDGRTSLVIATERSFVRIHARSNVGPIDFNSSEVTGDVSVQLTQGAIDLSAPPTASLSLFVASLSSGNDLYDAELRQRLHGQRYPQIKAQLSGAKALSGGRFAVDGHLTIHGTTRTLGGTVQITLTDHPRLFVEGEQVVDMRDFDIRLPNALMLRIYPDVLVRFRLEAEPEVPPPG